MIVPFSNEVGNVLTSSGMKVFSSIYKDTPKTNKQKLSKTIIDLIALSGIILNAAHVAAEHGELAGIIKGVGVVIIAFVIPNLTFHTLIHKFGLRRPNWQKLIFGLVLVGALTGLEILFDLFVVQRFHKKPE